jgi:hypothetical protein
VIVESSDGSRRVTSSERASEVLFSFTQKSKDKAAAEGGRRSPPEQAGGVGRRRKQKQVPRSTDGHVVSFLQQSPLSHAY